jgi:tRNA dimethylallyltransferase
VLSDILKRKKLPVVVGGTYHYIDYLFYQDNPIPVPPDRSLREQLALLSVHDLQQKLYQRDTELLQSLNRSDRQNPHRLIRKIEITASCQGNERHQLKDKALSAQYDIEIHGFIHTPRKKTAEKIERRVRDRLKAGAVDETRKILHNKYTQSCPGLQALGYNQIIQYLKGELAYNELVALWTRRELQYAKRQETLMKKNPDLIWHEIT